MRPLLLLATLTLPTITHAKPCPTPDPAAIVTTTTSMYAAATVDDSAKLAKLFTPDAVEFDRGERYTGMALWDLIKVVHAKGTKLVWTVQDTDVHFACDTAWIDYSNRGSVSDGKTTQPVSWLESAILVHGASGWKIRFFHSTQVPPLAK